MLTGLVVEWLIGVVLFWVWCWLCVWVGELQGPDVYDSFHVNIIKYITFE